MLTLHVCFRFSAGEKRNYTNVVLVRTDHGQVLPSILRCVGRQSQPLQREASGSIERRNSSGNHDPNFSTDKCKVSLKYTLAQISLLLIVTDIRACYLARSKKNVARSFAFPFVIGCLRVMLPWQQ